jgi:hypothetical protein
MSITRNRLAFERNFVQVPNEWMRDPRLSRRARGLLAEIMSHTVGWEITVESLVANGPEGRDAIRAAIVELETAGYLVRKTTRASGKFSGTDYMIQEPPSPAPENPTLVNDSETEAPAPEKPTLVNPTQRTPSFKNSDLLPSVVNQEVAENPKQTQELALNLPDAPEKIIADTLHERYNKSTRYMAIREVAKWAIKAHPERDWRDIGRAMDTLYGRGRPVTRQLVELELSGKTAGGQPAKVGTTELRVMAGMAVAERYREQERTTE